MQFIKRIPEYILLPLGFWLLVSCIYLPAYRAGFYLDFVGLQDIYHNQSFPDFINRAGTNITSLYQVTQFELYCLLKLFGLHPVPWFLLFTGLHALNGYLVYRFFTRFFTRLNYSPNKAVVLIGVLFFLISPVVACVVIWKACFHYLTAVMMMFVILNLTLSYLDSFKSKYAIAASLAYLISIFSLELFYLTPAFVFVTLITLWYSGKLDKPLAIKGLKRVFAPLVGLWLIHLIIFYLVFHKLQAHYGFKIQWFIWSQIVCYAIAIIIAIIVLKKISNITLAFSIDVKKVLKIIRGSFPYALLIFLMSIYTRSDMTLIERLGGAAGREQAGIYAAAYRLLDVGNMFGLMFAGMLLPLFARMLAQRQDVQPIVQLCVNLLLPASFLFTVCGVFFGSEIMHLLYREATEVDGWVFTWLMIAFPAFSLSNVYSTLLTANGNLKLLNKIAFVGVVINLSLNFILIPRYYSLGAAFSACITQTVLAICFSVFAQKQVNLAKNKRWVISFLAYLAIMLSGGYLVKHYIAVSWLIQLVMMMVTGVLLILMFRFVSIKAARQLLVRD